MKTKTITDQKVGQLVAFLKTLTDPCTKSTSCLAPWILFDNDTDKDPNGDQLIATELD